MSFLLEASDVFFNMKTLGLVSREIKASFVFLHKQQKALFLHKQQKALITTEYTFVFP